MKLMLTKILFLVLPLTFTEGGSVAEINKLKRSAKEAYLKGDFKGAVKDYLLLKDSLGVSEVGLDFNLATAYLNMKDTVSSLTYFKEVALGDDKNLKSLALEQTALVAVGKGKYEEALTMLEDAMLANPANDNARYNYEVVKRMLDQQKNQKDQNQDNKDQKDKDQKDKNKDNKDQKNKDNKNDDKQKKDDQKKDKEGQDKKDQNKDEKKDKEGQDKKDKQGDKKEDEKKDEEQKEQGDKKKEEEKNAQKDKEQKDQEKQGEQSTDGKKDKEQQKKAKRDKEIGRKLQEMKLSKQKAEKILEAMRNSEKQYIQQLRRKPSKPSKRNSPQW